MEPYFNRSNIIYYYDIYKYIYIYITVTIFRVNNFNLLFSFYRVTYTNYNVEFGRHRYKVKQKFFISKNRTITIIADNLPRCILRDSFNVEKSKNRFDPIEKHSRRQ